MKSNLTRDLSTLTTIEEQTLSKLFKKVSWCICDTAEKAALNNDNIAEIESELGTLKIIIEDNNIRYKFEPSQALNKAVTESIVNEKNSLVSALEESLVNKISSVYKNFF